MVKEIIENKPISISKAKEILKKEVEDRKERGQDIGYAQRRSYDYAFKFSKLDNEDAKDLVEELLEHDKVTPGIAVKIVDIMPKEAGEIRSIYEKERFAIDNQTIEDILGFVDKYR